MVFDGLSDTDIEAVQRHLICFGNNDLVPTKHHVLRQMIEGVKAVPTAMNVSVAQGTYFRGMKLALAEIDRRYRGQRVEDGDVVDRILLSRSDPRLQVSSVEVDRAVDRLRDPPVAEPAPPPQAVPMADFSKFAEDVIKLNSQERSLGPKDTAAGEEHLESVRQVHGPGSGHPRSGCLLCQAHAGKFVDFLLFEIYKHYGKSVRDEKLTIAQLREKGRRTDKRQAGRKKQVRHRRRNRQSAFDLPRSDLRLRQRSRLWRTSTRSISQSFAPKATRIRVIGTKGPSCLSIAPGRSFARLPFNNCAGWDALE